MRKTLITASLCAFAAFAPAHAITVTVFTNGWDLRSTCGNPLTAGFINRGPCHNFITNVGNGLARTHRICLVRGTTDRDLVIAVQDFIRERTDRLNASAREVAAEALSRAYPCRYYR
ncbi:MAG TPA: Rap1a/Tai family immunity protein [Rhizomicrobium sp.]|jgi:hypothetical protein